MMSRQLLIFAYLFVHCVQINQIMRVNKIYTQEVFGDCQDGFGFQIKKVSVC